METKLLFENFDLIAQSPGGVQRLRELVLNLAFRGKLVPQDPKDEPASVLLERIRAEKVKMAKEGKVREPKELVPIRDEEKPFEVPKGWEWVRLAECTYNFGQKVPKAKFTYIDVTGIDKERGRISEDLNVISAADAPSRARKIVSVNTVIYSTVRPNLLNIAIVDKNFEPEPIVSTAFAILHPATGLETKFLFYWLRSQPFVEFVNSKMKGMAYPAISDGELMPGLVPLPPVNEQKRILDELVKAQSACDEIESRQEDQGKRRLSFYRSTTTALNQAQTAPDFKKAWQRLADNFDWLYEDEENLKELRQTILQLAVRGKLVPQDSKDESASVLLERIRVEKAKLVKEGKIREPKELPPILDKEKPFELPTGWEWTRLGEICEIMMGNSPAGESYNTIGKGTPLINGPVEFSADDLGLTRKTKFTTEPVKMCRLGDLLLCVRGSTTGRTNVAAFEACIGRGVAALRARFDQDFLNWFVIANRQNFYDSGTGSTFPSISWDKIAERPFPLPPVAEQKRIVIEIRKMILIHSDLGRRLRSEVDLRKTLAGVLSISEA